MPAIALPKKAPPKAVPRAIPRAAPKAVPRPAAKPAPKLAPKAAPKALQAAPKATPKATPKPEPKEAPKATPRASPAKAKHVPPKVSLDAYAGNLLRLTDKLDRNAGMHAVSLNNERRTSTGLLTLDLILKGGISPNMFIFSGQEQSSKTTLALTIMAASVDQKIGLRVLWDAEGSSQSSPDYIANIFENMGVQGSTAETVFGVRVKNEWAVPPLVILKDSGRARQFFRWFRDLLMHLPEVRYDNGKWWYVYFIPDAELVKKMKGRILSAKEIQEDMARAGHVPDTAQSRGREGLWCPAPSGALQVMLLLDSWANLTPPSTEGLTEDDAVGVQARYFAKMLPLVKGELQAKRVALLGINQMRADPLNMYGPKEKETGGNALKFNSDCRLMLTSMGLTSAPYKPVGEGRTELEKDLLGRECRYRYIRVKPLKNKLTLPCSETWLRLTERDGTGQAPGYCLIFDTFHYLVQTGQAVGTRKSFRLRLGSVSKDAHATLSRLKGIPDEAVTFNDTEADMSWRALRILIEGEDDRRAAVLEALGLPEDFDLRAFCFKQIRKGEAEMLYLYDQQQANTITDAASGGTGVSKGKALPKCKAKADLPDEEEEADEEQLPEEEVEA